MVKWCNLLRGSVGSKGGTNGPHFTLKKKSWPNHCNWCLYSSRNWWPSWLWPMGNHYLDTPKTIYDHLVMVMICTSFRPTQTFSGTTGTTFENNQHRGYFTPDKYTSLLIQSSTNEGSTVFKILALNFKKNTIWWYRWCQKQYRHWGVIVLLIHRGQFKIFWVKTHKRLFSNLV